MKLIKGNNYNEKIFTHRKNTTYKYPVKWDVIVNHITEGYMPGTLNWLENVEKTSEDRYKAEVSCHYLVTRKGEVYQLADLDHGTWHCIRHSPTAKIVRERSIPPNLYSVGIEHEGLHKDTKGALTPEQYISTLDLHKFVIEEYERINKDPFPIDRDHIIGHYEVDTVNRTIADPGIEFPWVKLLSDLKEWDIKRKQEEKPVDNKRLDIAQKWAVDEGIMRDEHWDGPATRHQMAWWLYKFGVWVLKQVNK